MTGNSTASKPSSLSDSSSIGPPDTSQLSPFAQLMNTLQQLQQSNPAKFAQVTQQIGANLQSAAQKATANGDTAAASELSQMATAFTDASKSGQLPSVQDLAKAMGGGHHHRHPSTASDSSSTSTSSAAPTSASSSNAASQALSQLFSAFQPNAAQSASTDPMSIIMSTIVSAGVGGATSA